MKNRHLYLLPLLSILTQPALASSADPFPECPKVTPIKAATIKKASQKNDSEWVIVIKHKKFGTNEYWTLKAVVTADSEEDALSDMKQGLSHLKFSHIVPDYSCNYYARHDNGKFDVELILERK